MHDRFTERVKKVMYLAREEAGRLRHDYIGTEHLLLGIIRDGEGIAACVLQALEVDLEVLRRVVEGMVPQGSATLTVGEIPFTPRAKRALENAVNEARKLGHNYVGTDHLLPAFLADKDCTASKALVSVGLSYGKVMDETLRILGESPDVERRTDEEPRQDNKSVTFDKFTERVKKVMYLSRDEAGRLHHDYIGTEHLLLGLIRDGEGTAITALQNLGVDLDDIRKATEGMITQGGGTLSVGEIPFTPRAKRALELAVDEARLLGHNYVGTEHLLLGLLREGEGIAARVLTHMGLDRKKVRVEVLRVLGETPAPAKEAKKAKSRPKKVRKEPSAATLSLYFSLSEFTEDEVVECIGLLSDLYRSVGGDGLVIKRTTLLDPAFAPSGAGV